jgi:aminopeptidase N
MRPGRGPRALRALVVALAVTAPGAVGAAAPSRDLDIDLDPGTRRFHAVALVLPASRDFRFELHESLKVTSAAVDGRPVRAVMAEREGSAVGWRVQMPAGADRVRLEYSGTLPPLDRSLDDRGVLRGLPPMASAEGSFLSAGSDWYPRPAPLFAYRVTVTVPGDQRAVVPGRLQSETVPSARDARYRARFEFAQSATGVDLMIGPWVIGERIVPRANGAPLRLRTYFPHELAAIAGLADGYLDDSRRYLERYGDEIGAYPFTEFSVVASPLPTGFAMPTLTYLGVDVLKLPFIRATSLGHEVLHNWWGNGVYVNYAAGNWSEGLTTFMADYAYKERESADAAREMRLAWLRDFAAVPPGAHQALASFRSRTHGAAAAVGYGKSAMLFVMLRDAIGAAAFARGIRAFWERERFRVASWSDLQAEFERAAGRPLSPFFEQWVNRAGGPVVTIAGARATMEGGKGRLTLAIVQAAPAYSLRLPLEIVFPDRTETRVIDVLRPRDVVTIDVDALPQGVRLDPALRVWRVLEPEQVPPILRQWIVAPAPRLAHASAAEDVREAALALARRVFENPPRTVPRDALADGSTPVLLAGVHADVDAALMQARLPPRPASLAGRGSAQVWTIARETGAPVAVVSADDAAALQALLAPLPHYGAQSWLVFEGRRVQDRGVWPAPGRLIPVQSDR